MSDRNLRNLIWILLYLDLFWLWLRAGGLTSLDLAVHAFAIAAAVAVSAGLKKTFPIPRFLVFLFAACTAILLLQLIPLPVSLFEVLAPVNAHVHEVTLQTVPDLVLGRQPAFSSHLHVFKSAVLLLDFVLILLLIRVGAPSSSWLTALVRGIALLSSTQLFLSIKGIYLIPYHEGTYAGLVNPNHFAVVVVVLFSILSFRVLNEVRELWRLLRGGGFDDAELSKRMFICGGDLILVSLLVAALYLLPSRSGLALFLLALPVVLLIDLFSRRSLSRRVRTISLVVGGLVLLGILVIFPFGLGVDKFARKGTNMVNRTTIYKVGLELIAEGQFLGTGLGSGELLIDPRMPKIPRDTEITRHLHNEPLHVLLELGWLGFVMLFLFLGWCFLVFKERLGKVHGKRKRLLIGLAVSMVILLIHSQVSFPLRTTLVRLFALLLLGFALGLGRDRAGREPAKRLFPLVGVALAVIACVYFGMQFRRGIPYLTHPSENVRFAALYARFERIGLFECVDWVEQLFAGDVSTERYFAEEPGIREGLKAHLSQNPTSIKGLNFWLILDGTRDYMNGLRYEESRFQGYLQQHARIRELAGPGHEHSDYGIWFVYNLYKRYLPEHELARLAEYEETFDFLIKAHAYQKRVERVKRMKEAEAAENPE